MTGRLVNPLTLLSMLLCVAVLALWVRSGHAADGIVIATGPHGMSGGRVFMPGVRVISSENRVRLTAPIGRFTLNPYAVRRGCCDR